MSRLVWYQFSDLHFRIADEFDRKRVLQALWIDIKKQAEMGLLPHFVLVTGDVAYSGKEEEYSRAEEEFFMPLLEHTGLDRRRLYLIPGNHDFDKGYLESLKAESIVGLDSREKVNTFLGNSRQRQMYLHAFSSYSSFATRLTQGEYFSDSPAYGYCDTFETSGIRVSITGLNSSWTCHFHQNISPGRSEKGLLLIGEHQFLTAVRNLPSDSLHITLVHHPVDWLADFETASLVHELTQKTNFLHHGHVHRPSDVSHTYETAHRCFIFGAACYDRRVGNDFYANGYTIVSLRPDNGTAILRLRKYSDSPSPHWTSNEDLLGEGSRGEHTFPLPSNLFGKDAVQKPPILFSTLTEIYRSSPFVTSLLRTRKVLSELRGLVDTQIDRYEELTCSYYSHSPGLSEQEADQVSAVAVFFGEVVLRRASVARPVAEKTTIAIAIESAEELLANDLPDEIVDAVHACAASWKNIVDWGKAAFFLAHDLDSVKAHNAVACALLGFTVLAFSNVNMASEVMPIKQIRVDTDEHTPITTPTRGRVLSRSIVELTIMADSPTRFMAATLIRFHLEQRMEQIAEAFASANRDFTLRALRLQLLGRPEYWSEQRFTIDTVKIIHLLMGRELYGEKSGDVWFRELLQNALDASLARKRIDPTFENNCIEISLQTSERHFTIRDSGVGMSRWHIENFFCRVGRSIWRSEELVQHFADKSAKTLSIGRFGVGFLSVFEVAAHVTVKTRFCLETSGALLKISSITEPFFVQEISDLPVGTEISIRFKDDKQYEPDTLVAKYLVYLPSGVTIRGLPPIPTTGEEALRSTVSRLDSSKEVQWREQQRTLPDMKANLFVALPISTGKTVKADKPEAGFPTTSSVRISNGGISVYQVSSDWIGSTDQYRYSSVPSSGLNGIQAILDFDAGEAPVTVSRNGLRISDAEARRVLDTIVNVAGSIWESLAEELFQDQKRAVQATKQLISALNKSAKPETSAWRRSQDSSWCDNEQFQAKAVALLLSYGVVEVLEGYQLNVAKECTLRSLREADAFVVVTTRDRLRSTLVQLYCSQVEDLRVITVADDRSVDLIHACNQKWTRIKSDEDLWAIVEIDETRDWQLCTVLPPEAALVSRAYFDTRDLLAIVLQRRRARVEQVVGLNRSEVSVPPRLLLNEDHAVWQQLEKKISAGDLAKEAVADLLKLFFALIVEERSRVRREREFQNILKRLLEACGLPENTAARISS